MRFCLLASVATFSATAVSFCPACFGSSCSCRFGGFSRSFSASGVLAATISLDRPIFSFRPSSDPPNFLVEAFDQMRLRSGIECGQREAHGLQFLWPGPLRLPKTFGGFSELPLCKLSFRNVCQSCPPLHSGDLAAASYLPWFEQCLPRKQ